MTDWGVDKREGWARTIGERVVRVFLTVVSGLSSVNALYLAFSPHGSGHTAGPIGLLTGAVFLGAAFVARTFRRLGRDAGRPEMAWIDDGTGTVDSVRFRARFLARGCLVTAVGLTNLVVLVVLVRNAGSASLTDRDSEPSLILLLVVCLAVTALVAWKTLRTRFLAVTADNLVVAFGSRRMRIPWDELADACPVTDTGDSRSWGTARHLVLLPRPDADLWLPEWFDKVGAAFTLRDETTAAMFPVDQVAAPNALLRAIRWNLTAPHTQDALIDGYEQDWPVEDAPRPPAAAC